MFRLFECCALSFFERFVLSFSLKIERFVSDSAEIWICGLYQPGTPEEPKGHYIFDKPEPLWNFGHGKSYTTFDYVDCALSDTLLVASDTLKVSVTIKNTGRRDGKEVVQLYVRDKVSTVATPIQQLKAFQKVLIKPGESQCVELSLPIAELALYNAKMEEVVEPGDFEIQIGAASDDIRFKKTITIN